MATLLTKNYQQISTISLTYGEVRTYAKYEDQSTTYNETYVKIKATYYTSQATLSFDSGRININSNATDFGYTTFYNGETDLKEISVTIKHNADGTCPEYGVYTAWWATFGGYGDTETSVYAPKINRMATILTATDFNDEGNPTITFNNPGGFRINAKLEVGSTQIVRENIPNTGSYTFNLTNAERTLLRQLCTGNSMSVREVIATCLSGTTESLWSYLDKTMTIVNANPIFSNFTFEDINLTTLALTGDSSVNVNGYSNTRATISTSNKAIAQKEASMIKYRYTNGTQTTDITYNDSSSVNGTINGTTSGTHNVYAIDSRNNTTLVTKLSSSVIEYQNITIDKQNSSILRNNNQVGQNAILTLNGTIWNNNFGLVTNSIKSVTYQLKKTDSSTWINGTTTITPTISNNTFTFTGQIASDNQDTTWDLEASYNVRVTITDELSSVTIDLILNSAKPTLSLDKEGVGVMGAYDTSLGGYLQVNGIPIGQDIFSTSETKTNMVWVDDEPIYRKVIYISSLPNATTSSYSHGISNVEHFTNVYGMAYRDSDGYEQPINGTRSSFNPMISRIIVDPGIGFGKTPEQNLSLSKDCSFLGKEHRVLIGVSRKRFIRQYYPDMDVDEATAIVSKMAVESGASIVRVHNVKATVNALRL